MKVEGVIFTQILESTIMQGVQDVLRMYPVIRDGTCLVNIKTGAERPGHPDGPGSELQPTRGGRY